MTPAADLAAVAREMVARTRAEQGLPPTLENPAALDRLAVLLDTEPVPKAAS